MSGEQAGALPRVGRYEILLDLRNEGFVSLMVAKVRGPNAGPLIVELSRVVRSLARSVEVKEAFLAEARAAGRVRHPNFVHPIDTLVHEGDLYGATEFALGARLDELWRAAATERYEIPLAVSLRILVDVLAGLSALHASGANTAGSRAIVHGDLGPMSVFITDRGDARLIHSGLSSVTSRPGAIGSRNTRLAYKAPEQLMSGVNAVPIGPAADVFAAGVLLWEVLQGARLFDDPTDVEVVEHIVYGEIPSLDPSGSRYMPIALLPLVANAIERNPDLRTPNAATLAEAISRAPGVKLATTEEVAAVMDQLMGPMIDRRRTKIEELMARSTEHASAEGSLRPVVTPHPRSMRTPVGFVYPPPSSRTGSFRVPPSTIPPSPRTPIGSAPDLSVEARAHRAAMDSRIVPPSSRSPQSSRTPSSNRPLTSARTLSQSRSRQSSGGATWLYYVMAGVVAGALIFSLIRGLTGSSTFGTAASGEDDNATPAAAVPASTIGKGSAPSRDELYRPAEEPAVAPTLEKSAAPADEPAAAAIASSTGKAGRVSADQPLGRRGAEGQDSLGPAAPRPARPTVKPATKSDIPAGI